MQHSCGPLLLSVLGTALQWLLLVLLLTSHCGARGKVLPALGPGDHPMLPGWSPGQIKEIGIPWTLLQCVRRGKMFFSVGPAGGQGVTEG